MARKGSSDTNTDFMLFAIIGVAAIIMFLATTFSTEIASAWRWLRYAELSLFTWIPSWVPIYGQLEIQQATELLKNVPSSQIDQDLIKKFDGYYAPYFSWIPGLILVLIGLKRLRSQDSVIRKKHDMESLLSFMAPEYPFLQDAMKDHPEKISLRLDRDDPKSIRYAMGVTEQEFVSFTPPIGLEEAAKKDTSMHRPILDDNGDFDEDLARRAFAAQLGNPYMGLDSLNEVERAIYNKLAKEVSATREQRKQWIRRYGRSLFAELSGQEKPEDAVDRAELNPGHQALYDHVKKSLHLEIAKVTSVMQAKKQGKRVKKKDQQNTDPAHLREQILSLDVQDVRRNVLRDAFIDSLAASKVVVRLSSEARSQDIMSAHAFIRCGLMHLLRVARNNGEIAVSRHFSHIKGVDRTLYWALQTEGRQTPFLEAAGIFTHLELELSLGRPVPVPEVTMAVDALMISLGLKEDDEAREAAEAFEEATGYAKNSKLGF